MHTGIRRTTPLFYQKNVIGRTTYKDYVHQNQAHNFHRCLDFEKPYLLIERIMPPQVRCLGGNITVKVLVFDSTKKLKSFISTQSHILASKC